MRDYEGGGFFFKIPKKDYVIYEQPLTCNWAAICQLLNFSTWQTDCHLLGNLIGDHRDP